MNTMPSDGKPMVRLTEEQNAHAEALAEVKVKTLMPRHREDDASKKWRNLVGIRGEIGARVFLGLNWKLAGTKHVFDLREMRAEVRTRRYGGCLMIWPESALVQPETRTVLCWTKGWCVWIMGWITAGEAAKFPLATVWWDAQMHEVPLSAMRDMNTFNRTKGGESNRTDHRHKVLGASHRGRGSARDAR